MVSYSHLKTKGESSFIPIVPSLRTREAVFTVFAIVAAAYCAFSIYLFFVLVYEPLLGWGHVVGGLFVLLSWFIVRQTRYFETGVALLLMGGTLLVTLLFITGGWEGTGFLWPFGFLPYASFLTTRRQAAFWLSVLFLLMSVTTNFGLLGIIHLYYSPVQLFNFFFCYLMFSVCILAFKDHADAVDQMLVERQRALERGKAIDEAALKSIGDGMFITDAEGKIQRVNTTFETLTGWQEEEVLGRAITQFMPLEEKGGREVPERERPLTRALAGKASSTGFGPAGYFYRDKKGRRFPIVASVSPIIVDRNIIGAIEVFRDVTHETDIDRAKSEFISIASHQLRTPISAIRWHADLLLDGNVGKLSSDQRNELRAIYKNNESLNDTVKSLLDVSRIEMGLSEFTPEPTDLRVIVKHVLSALAAEAVQKDISVVTRTTTGLPMAFVDPRAARIVVENLLVNAIRYSKSKGRVRVGLSSKDGQIIFTVADDGIGIPAEGKVRLFKKFYRADNARKTETDGMGIGLFLTHLILNRIGGTIAFVSEENKGTTFTVILPAKSTKTRGPALARSRVRSRSR